MTRYLLIALFALLLSNCQDVKNAPPTQQPISKPVTVEKPLAKVTALDCAQAFKQFCSFVSRKDKQHLKQYFKLPMDSTELWSLVALNGDAEGNTYKNRFTEADFNKHFEDIFTKEFIANVKEIDAAELFKKQLYITDVIIDESKGYTLDSYMQAEYDVEGSELILALNLRRRDGGEDYETAIAYFFTLDARCNIIFKKVVLAG